jgi:DNA polymerase-3 subunit epsilon
MRQIVLDTETTGLEPEQGHRIIEIGCVELVNRQRTGNQYHQYINPDREIDEGAIEVHGITTEFLANKPRFADIADEFVEFIRDAELIIHNAAFDVGFINHELVLLDAAHPEVNTFSRITDTLALARKLHPGQRNSLDALCKRYEIDNSQRELHGALLDAEILADVYLAMTGGQVSLSLNVDEERADRRETHNLDTTLKKRKPLRVIRASDAERALHEARLEAIEQASDGKCVWLHAGESET